MDYKGFEYWAGLIVQLDKTLSMARFEWMKAGGKDLARWAKRIDDLLAERFKLMQLRDAEKGDA